MVLRSLLVVLVALCIAWSVSAVVTKGGELDRSSKAYVDAAVPLIVDDWNPETLLSRSSAELRAATNPEDLKRVFKKMASLGKLEQYGGARGEANVAFRLNLKPGASALMTRTSASYVADARFEKAPAKITVALIRRDDQWQIFELRIHSPLFLE